MFLLLFYTDFYAEHIYALINKNETSLALQKQSCRLFDAYRILICMKAHIRTL